MNQTLQLVMLAEHIHSLLSRMNWIPRHRVQTTGQNQRGTAQPLAVEGN